MATSQGEVFKLQQMITTTIADAAAKSQALLGQAELDARKVMAEAEEKRIQLQALLQQAEIDRAAAASLKARSLYRETSGSPAMSVSTGAGWWSQ